MDEVKEKSDMLVIWFVVIAFCNNNLLI